MFAVVGEKHSDGHDERGDADDGGEGGGAVDDLGHRAAEVELVDEVVDHVTELVEDRDRDENESEEDAASDEEFVFEGEDEVGHFLILSS